MDRHDIIREIVATVAKTCTCCDF